MRTRKRPWLGLGVAKRHNVSVVVWKERPKQKVSTPGKHRHNRLTCWPGMLPRVWTRHLPCSLVCGCSMPQVPSAPPLLKRPLLKGISGVTQEDFDATSEAPDLKRDWAELNHFVSDGVR